MNDHHDGLNRQARNPSGLPDRCDDQSFHRQVGTPHDVVLEENIILRLVMAMQEAERMMAYFAGETDNVFVGSGTPRTCLAQIREALKDALPPLP